MRPMRRRRDAGLAAMAALVLAGCQSMPRPQFDKTTTAKAEEPVKLKPAQMADMQFTIARSMEKRGELDQAEANYLAVLDKDPRRADACHRLAVVYDRQGRFAESGKLYTKALGARPDDPDILADVGYSLYLQGRADDAARPLERAVSAHPDHARARNNLGLVRAAQNRQGDALREFALAGCDKADAHCNLAYALTLAGSLDQAAAQYQQALAASPNTERARRGLQTVQGLQAKANPPMAETMSGVVAAGATMGQPVNGPVVTAGYTLPASGFPALPGSVATDEMGARTAHGSGGARTGR